MPNHLAFRGLAYFSHQISELHDYKLHNEVKTSIFAKASVSVVVVSAVIDSSLCGRNVMNGAKRQPGHRVPVRNAGG